MAKKEIDGIEINDKSIITALKIIKQVCEDNCNNNGNCKNSCPFRTGSVCGITDLEPNNWSVYEKFQALG